jgi:1-acyl-sn-glycerol-3-phosphate acyltransferase
MRNLAGRIVWIYAAIMVAGFFILTYPILLLFVSHPRLYPLAHGYRKVWGWLLILVCGLWPKVRREHRLSRKKKYVFVPNHSSYLDIVTCACLLPGTISFMAKQELRNVPLFGIFFRTIDIPVNRKSNAASHRAFLEAGKRLAKGMNILIFPEGTIPAHTPELGRFKIGAFRLAIEQGAEIVPVSIPDNYRRLPDGKFTAFPGKMRMTIHRPLPTAHLNPADAEALKDEVYRIIEEALIKEGAIPTKNV